MARVSTARTSCTMGFVLSATLGVVRAYVLFKTLSKAKKKTIEKLFGTLVSAHANTTGSMRSETHVNWFLKDVYPKALMQVKTLLNKQEAHSILVEDNAPGHVGDCDTLDAKRPVLWLDRGKAGCVARSKDASGNYPFQGYAILDARGPSPPDCASMDQG